MGKFRFPLAETIVFHAVSKQSIVDISLFSLDLAQSKLTRLQTVLMRNAESF